VFESELPRLAFYSCASSRAIRVMSGVRRWMERRWNGGCWLGGSIRGRVPRANQEGGIGEELESVGDRSLRVARSRESHTPTWKWTPFVLYCENHRLKNMCILRML
jgi:hypothetical protein